MIVIELDNFIVKIRNIALEKMLRFRQDKNYKHESGGILLGYFIDDTSFILTDITVPSNFDRSSRFNFVRAKESVQQNVNRFFNESDGKKIYLGEWHTHPEDLPTPSHLDYNSIKRQIKFNKLNSNTIFMIIIGNLGLCISVVKLNTVVSERQIPYNQFEDAQRY